MSDVDFTGLRGDDEINAAVAGWMDGSEPTCLCPGPKLTAVRIVRMDGGRYSLHVIYLSAADAERNRVGIEVETGRPGVLFALDVLVTGISIGMRVADLESGRAW